MTRPTIGEERAARGSQHIALCALDVLRADDIDPLTAQRRPIDRFHSCGAEKPRDQPLLHTQDSGRPHEELRSPSARNGHGHKPVAVLTAHSRVGG